MAGCGGQEIETWGFINLVYFLASSETVSLLMFILQETRVENLSSLN